MIIIIFSYKVFNSLNLYFNFMKKQSYAIIIKLFIKVINLIKVI